ncbi:MAG: helix-turn-helix transcriptional regulator, partial [Alphaproteobacteria bacterium]|nr:helix-turn-helix transcriptional regulator [Alphaproteobacteria bacterium]
MPSGKQIRAARVLLDWTAEKLASEVGISRESIESIELGKKQARELTMDSILRVFDDAGIEFLDNQGVRFRPEGLEILEGEMGIKTFLDGAYAFAERTG